MSLDITGTNELASALKALEDRATAAAARALYREAEQIITASKELVPVDTGFLRSTGHVEQPEILGTRVEVALGYNADYALPVHERMHVHHPVGQAKYLEQPFLEAMDGMADRVQAAVASELDPLMALLEDIGAVLQTAGVGTLGTTLFLGLMPATPHECVSVHEYSGAPPLRSFRASLGPAALERPRIQIKCRAGTYAAARTKALQVQAALDWLTNYTSAEGWYYGLIESVQRPPFIVEIDANDRAVFAQNFQVHRST